MHTSPTTRYCHCCISPVEPDCSYVRLLLHGWQYIRQHLVMQKLTDFFVDFIMHSLCHLLVFPPHNRLSAYHAYYILDLCARQTLCTCVFLVYKALVILFS